MSKERKITSNDKNNQKSYTEAAEELERIVASLEQCELNIDLLTEKIKIATELLRYCKNMLYSVEQDMNDMLQKQPDNS